MKTADSAEVLAVRMLVYVPVQSCHERAPVGFHSWDKSVGAYAKVVWHIVHCAAEVLLFLGRAPELV